jgi:hypothetical protein
MGMYKNLFFAGVCCAVITKHGLAGPIEDNAKQAEIHFSQGKFSEALSSIDAARELVWNAMPLGIRNATFVTSEPAGFGVYDTRGNNTFKPDTPLLIYFESQGYGLGRDGELYTIDFLVDFEVKSVDGESLAKKEGLNLPEIRSRSRNHEFYGSLTYTFTGFPPGEYEVVTTVHDRNSNKQADFPLKFNIVP